jgi:outer membrane lipoprotein-sorting protein
MIKSCIALLLLTYSTLLFAANDPNEEKLKKIQAVMAKRESAQIRFSQEAYKSIRKRTQTSSGYAYFAAPDKFRWIVEKPISEELIFDGQTFMQYRPEEKVATKYGGSTNQNREIEQLIGVILSTGQLTQTYNILEVKEQGDETTVKLSPQSGGDLVGVTVKAKKSTGTLTEVFMEYSNGNSTKVTISDFKTEIPIGVFSLELPKEVKVTTVK